ncbi:hypothetical protein MIND_00538200 [Mycena indigotica]|uniref:Uncharacterized protein n=1 Tax=Mycena indigotica TaxID=2126181 RepID=A0A8H6SWV4_9AGAR|nr:uncharacterized protein MIND_00538200 [Mycena indigotica]KAF7307438.1 hypothetical protein MIND_00538200 [Mycena indigotica]
MASTSVPRKRTIESSIEAPPAKVAKMHPFFSKTSATSTLRWLKPLGSSNTCLHGVNMEPLSVAKVAALDLDGTLIAGPNNRWRWWNKSVPTKLSEIVKDGYALVIITNQAGLKKPEQVAGWKRKLASIAAALPEVPFRVFAAVAKDEYRKPMKAFIAV